MSNTDFPAQFIQKVCTNKILNSGGSSNKGTVQKGEFVGPSVRPSVPNTKPFQSTILRATYVAFHYSTEITAA